MRVIYSILFATIFFFSGFSQAYNPIAPPNTFQNPDNPYYWKNKKPFTDYWQQDVHYKMDIIVDERTDIIHGIQNLTYWNNSPDTLHFVYFHLYQNAFQPGSYLDDLREHNHAHTRYGQYEVDTLGTTINRMQVNGQDLKTELDNTILKVYLNEPLLSELKRGV